MTCKYHLHARMNQTDLNEDKKSGRSYWRESETRPRSDVAEDLATSQTSRVSIWYARVRVVCPSPPNSCEIWTRWRISDVLHDFAPLRAQSCILPILLAGLPERYGASMVIRHLGNPKNTDPLEISSRAVPTKVVLMISMEADLTDIQIQSNTPGLRRRWPHNMKDAPLSLEEKIINSLDFLQCRLVQPHLAHRRVF